MVNRASNPSTGGSITMPIILLWFIFAVFVGFSAMGQGRSFWLWFFIATLISPLFAWLILKVISGK
jgi:ABC-type multidrug transport system permease subunit